jgi:hypothetical protein
MIEDALRETFAGQVAGLPPTEPLDSAERRAEGAMIHGRRVRQRQTMSTALAGVLIVAIVSLVTFHIVADDPAGQPAADVADGPIPSVPPIAPSVYSDLPPGAAAAPMEVASGGEIYTQQGKTQVHLSLPDDSHPASIWRASDGYLAVVTLPGAAQQLVLVDKVGTQSVLLTSAEHIVISPDGEEVAWLASGMLSVASRLTDRPGLGAPRKLPVPEATLPVAFLGRNVVLGRIRATSAAPKSTATNSSAPGSTPAAAGGAAGPGLSFDAFDLWYPAHDTYTPQWNPTVLQVFGSRPDGQALYAQVSDPDDPAQTCLAALLPAQPFKVVDTACDLPAPTVDTGTISPDGNWLAYPVQARPQVAVVDLKQVFTVTAAKARVLSLEAPCVRTAWLSPTSLVADCGGKFVTVDPTEPTQQPETAAGTSTGKVLIQPLRQ